jgi:hypothetical protein
LRIKTKGPHREGAPAEYLTEHVPELIARHYLI